MESEEGDAEDERAAEEGCHALAANVKAMAGTERGGERISTAERLKESAKDCWRAMRRT